MRWRLIRRILRCWRNWKLNSRRKLLN
jgi:hypothetical protein